MIKTAPLVCSDNLPLLRFAAILAPSQHREQVSTGYCCHCHCFFVVFRIVILEATDVILLTQILPQKKNVKGNW